MTEYLYAASAVRKILDDELQIGIINETPELRGCVVTVELTR